MSNSLKKPEVHGTRTLGVKLAQPIRQFFSLFNRTSIRIISSFVLASVVFLAIPFAEKETFKIKEECPPASSPIYCEISNSKLLGLIESFSIVVIAILFLLEASERKKQACREAWKIIDGARGVETSGARFQALEELNKQDNHRLKGLDADGADLAGINLEKAILEKASLRNSDLQEANLYKASLSRANLQEANLKQSNLREANLCLANLHNADLEAANLQIAKMNGANFRQASLYRANLQGASLQGADLCEATLRSANLRNADLRGAKLSRANLRGAIITDADIAEVNLVGVRDMDLSQLKLAKNWEKAKYDKDFHPELVHLVREESVEKIDTENSKQISAERKLLGLLLYKIVTTDRLKDEGDLSNVLKKIEQAIHVLESNDLSDLENDLPIQQIRDSVEIIVEKDKTFRDYEKTNLREKLIDLDENNNRLRQAKQNQRIDLLVSEWMECHRRILKERGLSIYLDRHPQTRLIDGTLDSNEKIKQFSQDIDSLLKLLANYLSKSQRPVYDGNLQLPVPMYLEIIAIILYKVVPQIVKERDSSLSNEGQERLEGYFNYLSKEISKLSS